MTLLEYLNNNNINPEYDNKYFSFRNHLILFNQIRNAEVNYKDSENKQYYNIFTDLFYNTSPYKEKYKNEDLNEIKGILYKYFNQKFDLFFLFCLELAFIAFNRNIPKIYLNNSIYNNVSFGIYLNNFNNFYYGIDVPLQEIFNLINNFDFYLNSPINTLDLFPVLYIRSDSYFKDLFKDNIQIMKEVFSKLDFKFNFSSAIFHSFSDYTTQYLEGLDFLNKFTIDIKLEK